MAHFVQGSAHSIVFARHLGGPDLRAPAGITRMGNPISLFATRAAYAATQLPRIAWYVGPGLAMRRLSERARQDGRTVRPRPHTDAPVPDRRQLFADLAKLLQRDLANVEAGIYPLPQ